MKEPKISLDMEFRLCYSTQKFERWKMDQLQVFGFRRGYNFYYFYFAEVYPLPLADL